MAVNIYFERDPKLTPDQTSCPNPASLTQIKVSIITCSSSEGILTVLVCILGRSRNGFQYQQLREKMGRFLRRGRRLKRLREPEYQCTLWLFRRQLPWKRSHQCSLRFTGLQHLYRRQSIHLWTFQRNAVCRGLQRTECV